MRIRPAKHEDLTYIINMCDKYIGPDYYTAEYLERAFRDAACYFTVYANEDDIPVAFIYMLVATFTDARRILKIPVGISEQNDAPDCRRVGVFKTTCTEEEYRRQGILSELMNYCENVFRDIGIKEIYLDALKLPSGKIPAESGLEKMRFKKLTEISRPWSDVESFCPYCKRPRCICDAVLCYKEID